MLSRGVSASSVAATASTAAVAAAAVAVTLADGGTNCDNIDE